VVTLGYRLLCLYVFIERERRHKHPPAFIELSNKQEATMAEAKQAKGVDVTKIDSPVSRIGHWVRVVVMCLSFGFIFPHAMTEDDDIAKVKKQ
jgi:hypothetical protein